jgi:hypothetical protein
MHFRFLVVSLIAVPMMLSVMLLVGCGPTRTGGTAGFAAKDLAILSISQLPEEAHIQIQSIQFDGNGDVYKIDKSRDFYLTPGDHTASFTLVARVPKMEGMGVMAGLASWLIPKNALTLPSLRAIPLGAVAAGKTYELSPSMGADSVERMLQNGSPSLVREKAEKGKAEVQN